MAHFHDFNPWATKLVYLPSLEELAEALVWKRPVEEQLVLWHNLGKRLDAYVIKSGDNYFSAGIRYGEEPDKYLALFCDQDKLETLYYKYDGGH